MMQVIFSGLDSPSKNFGIEGAHHLDYKYKVRHGGHDGDRSLSNQWCGTSRPYKLSPPSLRRVFAGQGFAGCHKPRAVVLAAG